MHPPDLSNPYQAIRELAEKLRNPDGGCPWDLKQNFQSVAPDIIEEAYELTDAIDHLEENKPETVEHFKEELGDLLFQVVFQSQMATEKGLFTLDDVLLGITQKLILRHPHVFTNEISLSQSEDVLMNWEKIKARERQKQEQKTGKDEKGSGLLGQIPESLPALFKAHRLGQKASRFHFDWNSAQEVFEKVKEEMEELHRELDPPNPDNQSAMEEELGDVLFTLAQLARKYSLNPEEVLQKANKKFVQRFHICEDSLREKIRKGEYPSTEEWEMEWEKAKKLL